MHNEYGVKNGWLNRKGRLMHQIVMRPSGRAKTVVLFAHGAAEHCEREGYKVKCKKPKQPTNETFQNESTLEILVSTCFNY